MSGPVDGAADGSASGGVFASTTMALIAAGRLAQRQYESVLAERGLSLRLVGALGHLAHDPDLSYSDLARRARVTPQSMHATIGQLVELGAVTTRSRGRASYPQLTTHGRELLVFAADAAAACDTALLGDAAVHPGLRAELMRIAMQTFTSTSPSGDQ